MNPVLSAPAPMPANAGRKTLVLMLALFLLPVLVAAGLYLTGWRPDATGNYGELLQPPRTLPAGVLADTDHHWRMVYLAGSACDAECVRAIDQMRRIHVLLNKEMDRVRRIALVPGGTPDPALAAAVAGFPDMRLLTLEAGARAAFPGFAPASPGRLYLVDPAGNVMMRYAPGFQAGGVKKDLERLLKYSWIG